MPAYVPEVIMWTFVIAFIFCMIAALLTMTGLWTPPDPKVRKWLVNGVLISAVGAVVPFGVRQFAPSAPAQQEMPGNRVQPAPAQRLPQEPAPHRPPATPERDIPTPPAQPTPTDQSSTIEIPESLRSWVAQALEPRPLFPASAGQNYPSCVQNLNAGSPDAATTPAARACLRDLQRFHRDVILAYYNIKGPYDDRLEAQELELRGGRLQPEELERFNFVRDEMERLNGPESQEIQRLSELEDRLMADQRACARSKCRRQ